MQSHYCANDNKQALKMSWIDAIADSINELTDSFLPRANARLPYECEHFFVMIGVGVILFDEFWIWHGLMSFCHDADLYTYERRNRMEVCLNWRTSEVHIWQIKSVQRYRKLSIKPARQKPKSPFASLLITRKLFRKFRTSVCCQLVTVTQPDRLTCKVN